MNPGIADGDSFCIKRLGLIVWLAWKLGYSDSGNYMVILKLASPEQSVLAAGIDVVIDSRNVGVVAQRGRRVEAITSRVDAVPDGAVVRLGILLEQAENIGRWTYVQRVYVAGDFGGCHRRERSRYSGIGESPLTEEIRGHRSNHAGLAAVTATFVIGKDEELVLNERPANGGAENVPDQRRAWEAGLNVQRGVRGRRSVAIEFVKSSMQRIRAALGDKGYLGS